MRGGGWRRRRGRGWRSDSRTEGEVLLVVHIRVLELIALAVVCAVVVTFLNHTCTPTAPRLASLPARALTRTDTEAQCASSLQPLVLSPTPALCTQCPAYLRPGAFLPDFSRAALRAASAAARGRAGGKWSAAALLVAWMRRDQNPSAKRDCLLTCGLCDPPSGSLLALLPDLSQARHVSASLVRLHPTQPPSQHPPTPPNPL